MKYRKTLIFMTAAISLNASAQQTFTYDGDPNDLRDYGTLFLSSFGGPVNSKDNDGSPSDNKVIIEETLSNAPIYIVGGFSLEEDVSGNSVIMTGGTGGQNLIKNDIYGGYSSGGDVSDNSINMSGGTVNSSIYGGYSDTGSALNNSVQVTAGTIGIDVYGGYSSGGDVSDNSIDMSGGTVNSSLYGGYSDTGSALNNSVQVTGGTVSAGVHGGFVKGDNMIASGNSVFLNNAVIINNVFGGQSTAVSGGLFNNNSVTITGGSVGGHVYGARTAATDALMQGNSVVINSGSYAGGIYGAYGAGTIKDSKVTINGGQFSQGIFGGLSTKRDVSSNIIYMSGGTVNNSLFGGYSETGSALNNSVQVTGGTVSAGVHGGFVKGDNMSASGNSVFLNNAVITNNVYGGQSTAASGGLLNNNSVTITGGSVGGHVYGARTAATGALMQGNSVVINSGQYTGSIYGAYGEGTIEGSKVTINGGQFSQNIFGGYIADEGDVTQSYITINGGHIQGDIYGGYGPSAGMISGHTITISGGTIDGNIYGGVASAPENIKDNTLIFDGFQGTVAGIDGFDHYEFILPSEMRSGDTQVIVSTNAPNLSGASVQLVGVEHSLKRFSIGDQLTLLSHVTNSDKLLDFKSERVKHGVTYTYDFSLVNDPNSLTLSVKDVEVNPQLKSLSAAQLSSLAFINQNADELSSISSSLVQRAMNQPIFSNSILTFARVNGGDSRYKTGSHADVRGVSLLSGAAAYLKPTWLAGLFVEAGRGDFSSFNDFEDMASINARGNSRYYGGGILTRNDWAGGFYVDSALRLGQVETQYDSNDLFYLTASHYKTKALYFGAQAGLGYQMEMKRNFLLDLSARYLWNRQNGNTVTVAGDPREINLQAINSHRSRAQAKLSYQGRLFSPFIHMAYENEFDSYAKAQVLGDDMPAPSLAGGTAIGGVGVHIQSNKNSRSYLNIRAQGFLGEREGYSAQLEAGWVF